MVSQSCDMRTFSGPEELNTFCGKGKKLEKNDAIAIQ